MPSRAVPRHALTPFSPKQVEQVACIFGGTDDGLTGSKSGGMLRHLGFPDEGATQTKWKRRYNSWAHLQNEHNKGNHTVQLIMRPEGDVTRRDLFRRRQVDLNTVLAFARYYIRDDEKVASAPKAAALDEAFANASRMSEQLRARRVHDKILAFCQAEVVQLNYFHAVFEAMKSLKTRINEISGVDGDGATLIDDTFGLARGPIIAINALRDATDEG